MANNKIVVVGFGWVGQANALSLARMGYEVGFYDVITPKFHYSDKYYELYEKITVLKSLLEFDAPTTHYIVCVGDRVAEDGTQDITFIEKALEQLTSAQGKVILRSTILPTSLAKLPFHYYVPEFLHEIRAVEECLNPYYFVIGSRVPEGIPGFLEEWKARAYKVFEGTPEQAAYIKYLSNIWNAVRIAFVNEFGDSMMNPDTAESREKIEEVINFILEKKSYLRYGTGFGGHCLPKDMRAFRRMAESEGRRIPLLKGAYESNTFHEELSQKYQTLPQWFSTWDYSNAPKQISTHLLQSWQRFNLLPPIRFVRSKLRPARRLVDRYITSDSTLQDVKNRWNDFALHQPYYYSNPDTRSGRKADEFEAKETGEADYARLIGEDEILKRTGAFSDKKIVEIGSGVGRLTENLARHFAQVFAVDISERMLAIAQKRLHNLTNVTWLPTDGQSLSVTSASVDAVFAYQVFKYLPSTILISDYLKEIARVLVSGGYAKIHLRTGPEIYKRRWFYGVSVTPEQARELAQNAGLRVVSSKVENTKDLWLWLQKP